MKHTKTSAIKTLAYGTAMIIIASISNALYSKADPKIYWNPEFKINMPEKKKSATQPQQASLPTSHKTAPKKPQASMPSIRSVLPKLLIMMETDDASESLFSTLDHYYSKLSNKVNYRILLVTTNPDPAFEDPEFQDRLKTYKNLHAFLSAPFDTMSFKDDFSDIMIKIKTTQLIQTQNFDQMICKSFKTLFSDYNGFIYFDDEPESESGSMIPVVGKLYYQMCGNECLSALNQVERNNLEPLRLAELHYNPDTFADNRFYGPKPQNDLEELEYIETFDDEKPFVFITPSYNNINWYQKNLDSMLSQKYKNFRIIYIDDASTDGTADAVEQYLKIKDTEHRVTFIRNKERVGALANIYNAFSMCKPEEIIVMADGDDWLAHDKVLFYLNSTYHDTDVWMTYGQFRWWPGNQMGFANELPYEIIEKNQIRSHQWSATHLRTCYAWLAQKIEKKSLLWNGQFYQMAWDLALMFPMQEMAGFHSRYIPAVLYTYNVATPLNDQKVNRSLQIMLEDDIRRKPKYQPLSSAPDFDTQSDNHVNQGTQKIFIVDKNESYNKIIHEQLKDVLSESGFKLEIVKSLSEVHNPSLIAVYDIALKEIPNLMRYPREKLALFIWQSPDLQPYAYDTQYHKHFGQIYTLHDALIDNKTYFKLFYPLSAAPITPEDLTKQYHKKLCTLVGSYRDLNWSDSELYSERRRAADYFDQHSPQDFELYGKNWEQFGYQTYKGEAQDPIAVMKNFKFCLCYENSKNIPGFITHKIFDAFTAGCVPIYDGAPNIADYIPKSCFISLSDFRNYQDLFMFINNMSPEIYNTYRKNIAEFMASKEAQKYSAQEFITLFGNMIRSLVK